MYLLLFGILTDYKSDAEIYIPCARSIRMLKPNFLFRIPRKSLLISPLPSTTLVCSCTSQLPYLDAALVGVEHDLETNAHGT